MANGRDAHMAAMEQHMQYYNYLYSGGSDNHYPKGHLEGYGQMPDHDTVMQDNTDYFAHGMRPCLYQYPPWLHLLVSASSGHVHVRRPEDVGNGSPDGAEWGKLISPESQSTSAGGRTVSPKPGTDEYQGSEVPDADGGKLRIQLHQVFDTKNVQPWDPNRFVHQRDLAEAVRNEGKVSLMWDSKERIQVAAKQMPNTWMCRNHSDFVQNHPGESEMPWQDIGCTQYLNEVKYPHGCTLHGVHRDLTQTSVMTSFASEGDLFAWCGKNSMPPGPERENIVRPLAVQLMRGVQQLHELSIVHRDLSMENCLVSKDTNDASLRLYIIDFGMAQTDRYFEKQVRGKKSYVAPECHEGGRYDGYLSDAFAVGVSLYCILLMEYPWQSTAPGTCKCYDFMLKRGFRNYIKKRKLRNTDTTIDQVLSEPAVRLLEGLLSLDPATRLTLGENGWWNNPRRSVWDEEWLRSGSN